MSNIAATIGDPGAYGTALWAFRVDNFNLPGKETSMDGASVEFQYF
jgi:hypothetical protein